MTIYYLKFIYIKTRIHQKIYKDGSFPFKYYYKLTEYCNKYKISKALECGTAIGLTAISIVSSNKNISLDTIEKHQRNINKAKENFLLKNSFWSFFVDLKKEYNNTNFIHGRYLDILESEKYVDKKYDFIFLDAYISRINEVKFLSNYLEDDAIFVVSNIREEIPKSLEAKKFLLNQEKYIDNNFELLEIIEDTIFVRKSK